MVIGEGKMPATVSQSLIPTAFLALSSACRVSTFLLSSASRPQASLREF